MLCFVSLVSLRFVALRLDGLCCVKSVKLRWVLLW